MIHSMMFQKCIDWARYVLMDQALRGGGMRSSECPSNLICFDVEVRGGLQKVIAQKG